MVFGGKILNSCKINREHQKSLNKCEFCKLGLPARAALCAEYMRRGVGLASFPILVIDVGQAQQTL
jgi:hypothetical protein